MRVVVLLMVVGSVGCGIAPPVSVNVHTDGLTAADIKTIDLYLLDASGASRAKDCDALGTQLIAAREDVDVFALKKLTPTTKGTFDALSDGTWLIVAEAYADEAALGPRVAVACAKVPPIFRDETTRVTLVLKALP